MAAYGNTYKGNGWSEAGSYPSDHVCKPVIIDAQGRKRPIIALTQPYRSSEAEHHQHHVHPHGYSTEPAMVEHYRVEQKLHQTSDPIYKVEEIITKVQNEVSTPKFGPFNGAHQSHHSPKHVGFIDSHHGDKEWQRSNGHTHQNDKYEDYHRKPAMSSEPTMFTTDGGWARPTQTTWGSQPDSKISGATNNISTAIGYLKEAAKPSGTNTPSYSYRHAEPPYSETHHAKTAPRYNEAGYNRTIDSNGGVRRYGNFKFSPRTFA
ncbi:hypothetical protein LINGRAHAP2_LOCUS32103 [Linum grandiflorum]